MLITVFTPAYNRKNLLTRLYESLCKQTYKDFEWVIVDDGSTDETKELLQTLAEREETFFPLRYFYQENGGKHRAINRGVKEAQGELFFIADSDDLLPKDSLEIVIRQYADIKDDKSFAGVAGFDTAQDGNRIGQGCDFEVLDCNIVDFWYKYHVNGDMKEVFRTDVLKEIPFPEIEGEKFCPEELEWVRIAKKYKLRYINHNIYIAEYQSNGLSANIINIRMESPIASMMTYAISIPLDIPIKRKIRYAINYYRFGATVQVDSYKEEFEKYNVTTIPPYWKWLKPIGILMHFFDEILIKK